MRPRQGGFEVCKHGTNDRVRLAVLINALISFRVRSVKAASQDKDRDVTPSQHVSASWNDGDMHALGHGDSDKATVLGYPLHLTSKKEQKWELLKSTSSEMRLVMMSFQQISHQLEDHPITLGVSLVQPQTLFAIEKTHKVGRGK